MRAQSNGYDASRAAAAPLLSLSLDLDNHWSYLKTRGDPRWREWPSYLEQVAELILLRFGARELRITVFVVGRDAERPEHHGPLRAIAAAGHELGNHSRHHEPWFHLYDDVRVEREIADAERAIDLVTGRRPVGFRGPGFSVTPAVLRVLQSRGYAYDASTFPTFLGPLARAYYRRQAGDLSPDERARRRKLFGSLRAGRLPLGGYVWADADPGRLGAGRLVEIPVTTMPITRLPFHQVYLLYLARRSRGVALGYLRAALGLCRLRGIEPSFLLHPTDLLGGDRVDGLEFFPTMDLSTEFKLDFLERVLDLLQGRHRVVPLLEHARRVAERGAVERRPGILRA